MYMDACIHVHIVLLVLTMQCECEARGVLCAELNAEPLPALKPWWLAAGPPGAGLTSGGERGLSVERGDSPMASLLRLCIAVCSRVGASLGTTPGWHVYSPLFCGDIVRNAQFSAHACWSAHLFACQPSCAQSVPEGKRRQTEARMGVADLLLKLQDSVTAKL